MTRPYYIIIPARLEAQRLPNKPLLDLAGKPLIVRVYEQALKCGAAGVWVATDSDKIHAVAADAGAKVVMTAKEHSCGTERIFEAAKKLNLSADSLVVNIQGDEPNIPPTVVQQLVREQAKANAAVGTLATKFTEQKEIADPNIVKVVLDLTGHALLFSRAGIPYNRVGSEQMLSYRHIGLYSYTVAALAAFCDWEADALEQYESLEQLRFLRHGVGIKVSITEEAIPAGIDTAEDLARARDMEYLS